MKKNLLKWTQNREEELSPFGEKMENGLNKGRID